MNEQKEHADVSDGNSYVPLCVRQLSCYVALGTAHSEVPSQNNG
jgi:hypothetical protein